MGCGNWAKKAAAGKKKLRLNSPETLMPELLSAEQFYIVLRMHVGSRSCSG
jgi:hypothetical protein